MNGNNERPGMFTMLRSVLEAPFQERLARVEEARYERLSHQAASRMLEQTVRLVQPDNDGYTELLGEVGSNRGLDSATSAELRKRAIRASYRSPLMVGYLRTLKRFVMGRGPTFHPMTDDEKLNEGISDWWKYVALVNKWDVLEDEIPGRTWRDGESFIRRFTHDHNGPLKSKFTATVAQRLAKLGVSRPMIQGDSLLRGTTLLRILDPDQIEDPEGVIKNGIVTSSRDVQNVLGYLWNPEPGKSDKVEFVPAAEMEHTPINVDSDVQRGRSQLEPLLQRDKQYNDWLRYRLALSLARTAIVLHKQVDGATPTQIAALRDPKQRDSPGNDRKTRMFNPMTTITTGKGTQYNLLTPNLQAQDAQHDGRSLQLNMAAATGFPEFMFDGDSSNANYASALVSEGPAFREFESWQDFFTPVYRRIYRWAMEDGAKAGQIKGLEAEAAKELPVEVRWPNIEVRDQEQRAKRNEILHRNRVLSLESWAIDAGLDWEVERERLERELQDELEFSGVMEPEG
ncbi:MAG: phage portal protein [Gemmatimonadota bacterium]